MKFIFSIRSSERHRDSFQGEGQSILRDIFRHGHLIGIIISISLLAHSPMYFEAASTTEPAAIRTNKIPACKRFMKEHGFDVSAA